MVRFETQLYHKEGTDIVGAEVIVISESGDNIGTLQITSKTDFDDLVERLDGLSEDFVPFGTGSTLSNMNIDSILENTSNNIDINAKTLGGYTSNQYSRTGHKHPKTDITGLNEVNVTSSNNSPEVGNTITITIKVTNSSGQPVNGTTVVIYLNESAWKSGTTNSQGVFTTNYTIANDSPVVFRCLGKSLMITPKPAWSDITVPVGTLQVCEKLHLASYSISLSNITLTRNVDYNINNGDTIIPSQFCPPVNLRELAKKDAGDLIIMRMQTDGKLSLNGESNGTKTVAGYFFWKY